MGHQVPCKEPALTIGHCRITGQRVKQHAGPCRQTPICRLHQQRAHDPGEDIAHAGGRHARVSSVAYGGDRLTRTRDKTTGTFENDDALVTIDETQNCLQTIGLNQLDATLQQSSRLARVRGQYPIAAGPWLLGEQVIAEKAAMVSVGHGQGRVVLIGFRAQHRVQTHGTFKLVFNALLSTPPDAQTTNGR